MYAQHCAENLPGYELALWVLAHAARAQQIYASKHQFSSQGIVKAEKDFFSKVPLNYYSRSAGWCDEMGVCSPVILYHSWYFQEF